MKTNQVIWLVLVFLGVTLVQNAQAFYNPNTGRWLNRDPLGEAGFETLRHQEPEIEGDGPNAFLFVNNDPISARDSLGLKCKLKYKCTLTEDPPAVFVITTIGPPAAGIPWSYTEKECGYTCNVTSLSGTCPAGYTVGMQFYHYTEVKQYSWTGFPGFGPKCLRFPSPSCSKNGDKGSINF